MLRKMAKLARANTAITILAPMPMEAIGSSSSSSSSSEADSSLHSSFLPSWKKKENSLKYYFWRKFEKKNHLPGISPPSGGLVTDLALIRFCFFMNVFFKRLENCKNLYIFWSIENSKIKRGLCLLIMLKKPKQKSNNNCVQGKDYYHLEEWNKVISNLLVCGGMLFFGSISLYSDSHELSNEYHFYLGKNHFTSVFPNVRFFCEKRGITLNKLNVLEKQHQTYCISGLVLN